MAKEVGGDLVAEISPAAWRQVTRVLGLDTRLLEAYERSGPAGLLALALSHGLVPDPDPPGPCPRLVV